MKRIGWMLWVTLLPASALALDDGENEEKVALEAVPQPVKDAAVAAVPGLILISAEREIEKGIVVYDLEGKVGGVEYEVEVTADGKVLEVEREDGDGRDDDQD